MARAYAAKQVASMAKRAADTPGGTGKFHEVETEALVSKRTRLWKVAQQKQKTKATQQKLEHELEELDYELEQRKRQSSSKDWLQIARSNRSDSKEARDRERKKNASIRSTGKEQLSAAHAALETPSHQPHVRLSSTSRPWTDPRPKERLEGLFRESKSAQKPRQTTGKTRNGRASTCLPGATAENAMELVSSDEEGVQESPSKESRGEGNHGSHGRWVRRSPRVNSYKTLSQKLNGLKVVFPSSDTVHAVEVTAKDLAHLEDEEFLNDTIIDFYCKYLEETMVQDKDRERVHFFNAFFYKKLTQRPDVGSSTASVEDAHLNLNRRRHERVRKWTRNIDLFSKDYVFVPIHSAAHWSLAIICHPGATKSPTSDKWPCVLHLDSMRGGHSTSFVTKTLREYLEQEWICKMQPRINAGEAVERKCFSPDAIQCKRVTTIPMQNNTWDCGLFLLAYIEHFLQDPPLAIRPDRLKELSLKSKHLNLFTKKWFPVRLPSTLRRRMLTLILNIYCNQEGSSNAKLLQEVWEVLDMLLNAEEAEALRKAPSIHSPTLTAEGDPVSSIPGTQATSEALVRNKGEDSTADREGRAGLNDSEPEQLFAFGTQEDEKKNKELEIISNLEGRFARAVAAAPSTLQDLLECEPSCRSSPPGRPHSLVHQPEEMDPTVPPASLPSNVHENFSAFQEKKLVETQRKVASIDRIMCDATLA